MEVSWTTRRWAVAPPVVTVLDDSGGNAVLVGARPRWLMRRLDLLHVDPDPEVRSLAERIVPYEPRQQNGAPSARFLTGPQDDTLEQLCARLGIRFEQRVALRLRDALPTLDSYLASGRSVTAPPGMTAKRFVTEPPPGWIDVDDDSQDGAYEYEAYGAPRYQFCTGGERFEAEKSVVVYAELRRCGRAALFYDPELDSMYVPGRLPLPLLAARCLVLRTGLLPIFFHRPTDGIDPALGGLNRYPNIPLLHYKAICESVGQPLTLV
jgi:hypothetical protein